MKFFFFFLTILFVNSGYAIECNCSKHIGACSANVRLQQNTLVFQSNTNQCAQVVYEVNGEPSSITLTYGEGSTEYIGRDPQIQFPPSVRSCDICETTDQQQQLQEQQRQQELQQQQERQKQQRLLEGGLRKMNEWISYCHNSYPSCSENDRYTAGGPNDNAACVSLLRMCLNGCADIGNGWKVPAGLIQQTCPPVIPPFQR